MPVLSNPPLARALHSEVELGQTIPESFFAAVAEVLAFVFRTSRRSRLGRRALTRGRITTGSTVPPRGRLPGGSVKL